MQGGCEIRVTRRKANFSGVAEWQAAGEDYSGLDKRHQCLKVTRQAKPTPSSCIKALS